MSSKPDMSLIQSLVWIFGIDDAADRLDQGVHPSVLLQATDGACRQVVLDAGSLLGVKEEGVVQRQTQGQAAARPLCIPPRGQLPPSFL